MPILVQNQNQIFGPIDEVGAPTPVDPNARITESGESRVTESGEQRVIE